MKMDNVDAIFVTATYKIRIK